MDMNGMPLIINAYAPGEIIMKQGDEGDTFHLIRKGSVTISNDVDGRDVIRTYLPAGSDIGEMALLGNTTRSATITATVKTETVSIDKQAFEMLLERSPGLKEEMQAKSKQRYQQNVKVQESDDGGGLLSFLMSQGLG
jgi:CRP-like cAMP-binding protein